VLLKAARACSACVALRASVFASVLRRLSSQAVRDCCYLGEGGWAFA
jgi:hypothetical protein